MQFLDSKVCYNVYYKLANRALPLPGKLTKQHKGTHLDILSYTKFSLPWLVWVLEFGVPRGPRDFLLGLENSQCISATT